MCVSDWIINEDMPSKVLPRVLLFSLSTLQGKGANKDVMSFGEKTDTPTHMSCSLHSNESSQIEFYQSYHVLS